MDDDAYIDSILKRTKGGWVDSTVVYNNDSTPHNNSDRTSEQKILEIDQDGAPLIQILSLIDKVNQNTWNFDIHGTDDAKDAVAVYKYEVGGEFKWHYDFTHISPTRKLGFTLQLSSTDDYEGGDLEFMGEDFDPKNREKGALIIFPSWVWHQITPVTKGTRLSVVGWIHGPTFQ
jgi:PKHD-type hydroxylase